MTDLIGSLKFNLLEHYRNELGLFLFNDSQMVSYAQKRRIKVILSRKKVGTDREIASNESRYQMEFSQNFLLSKSVVEKSSDKNDIETQLRE